jgi:hypothetical protein
MRIKMKQPIVCDMSHVAPCMVLVISFLLIMLSGFSLFVNHAMASEEWLLFSKDKYSSGTKYYYNVESIQYFPDNRVSLWTKTCSSSGEQFLHTEISCASSLFRIVQPPPRGFWEILYEKGPNKTQYVVSGWYEIPPDSEVSILRRFLCNDPQKNLN